MLTTMEGTYREGRIHLKESPVGIREARVLVTFIEESHDSVPPGLRGLSPQQSATRLAALQATWAGRLSPSDTFAQAKAAPTNGAPPPVGACSRRRRGPAGPL